MVLKIMQKDVTPGIPYSGQFIEHAGLKYCPMFGAWKHVVWSYNATHSTYSMFIDGKKLNLPAALAKVILTIQMQGTALGDLSNSNVSKFIYRFSTTSRCSWNAPGMDVELHRLMDEFRVYNIALTENEVVALYKLER
jgi:hypothetical protein